jgi:hypothetical protein
MEDYQCDTNNKGVFYEHCNELILLATPGYPMTLYVCQYCRAP